MGITFLMTWSAGVSKYRQASCLIAQNVYAIYSTSPLLCYAKGSLQREIILCCSWGALILLVNNTELNYLKKTATMELQTGVLSTLAECYLGDVT